MKITYAFILLFIFSTISSAQQILYGTNNYVEYQVGTLPFVISVAHGGNQEPASIPNRTCNNPVYATDVFTIETAIEIKNQLYALTGCYPHLVISHLKRNKLDPNRNLADGVCGNAEAETAWNEFHNFIAIARNTANSQYSNKTFFVDLHGHGNPIQRIELGYLLYDDELELADNVLNTNAYINYSSIKNLVLNNVNNYTHAQLLRGQKSFGTLLTNYSFPAVPSLTIPFPGTSTNYFSGGYITVNHTCYTSGITINGLQMELNYTGIRDTALNRTQFASAFSQVVVEYMNTHFNMIWNSCAPLSLDEIILENKINMHPNPAMKGQLVNFDYLANQHFSYAIHSIFGQIIKVGTLSSTKNTISTNELNSGLYLITLVENSSQNTITKKLIIN
jgi:Secretion system C-terminal sorting domain